MTKEQLEKELEIYRTLFKTELIKNHQLKKELAFLRKFSTRNIIDVKQAE